MFSTCRQTTGEPTIENFAPFEDQPEIRRTNSKVSFRCLRVISRRFIINNDTTALFGIIVYSLGVVVLFSLYRRYSIVFTYTRVIILLNSGAFYVRRPAFEYHVPVFEHTFYVSYEFSEKRERSVRPETDVSDSIQDSYIGRRRRNVRFTVKVSEVYEPKNRFRIPRSYE